jgi:hypothetical protein
MYDMPQGSGVYGSSAVEPDELTRQFDEYYKM